MWFWNWRENPQWRLLLGMALVVGASAAAKAGVPDNVAFATVDPEANLPRVLIIGDSISIGYTLPTKVLLSGTAVVQRIPTNGGPTTRGLEHIESWLGDGDWDVIHFNWGLHDLKYIDGSHQVPIDEYGKNLEKLVTRLKQTGATLIWATTTPVPEGNVRPPRKNSDVKQYNAVAEKIMQKHNVRVDDLYAFAKPRLDVIQIPVNVHFTPAGSAALAGQVAEAIRAALKAEASAKQ